LPSPGIPQSSTITLSVTDDIYTKRMQFLYVARFKTSTQVEFDRPAGIYNLDPDSTMQRPEDTFVTGEMHRISWKDIDNGHSPLTWNWKELDDAVAHLPVGQDLSLSLTNDPCDIVTTNAGHLQYPPGWCDINPPKGQADDCLAPCIGVGNKPGIY